MGLFTLRTQWALVLILSLLFSLGLGLPTPEEDVQTVEQLKDVPAGWTLGGAAPPSALIRFHLSIRPEKEEQFEQLVLDISTPGHPKYGQHMKRDEVRDFLRPRAHISDAVLSWLNAEGVPKEAIDDNGDWISFVTTVGQAEKMLHTNFNYYHTAVGNGATIIRTMKYSVPAQVSQFIEMIQPTTKFGHLRPQASTAIKVAELSVESMAAADPNSTCGTGDQITPACLRELYQLGDFFAIPNPANKLGISGFLEQWARFADFNNFIDKFVPQLKGISFDVQSINNGTNEQNSPLSSIEASLDVDYAIGLSNGTATYFTTGGRGLLVPDLDQPNPADDNNEPYLDQLAFLLSLSDDELPTVLSSSYGEDEQSVPANFSKAACRRFAELGARGVSVIFGSGDTGVGSACQTNDGKNTTRFLPSFPASCPFVTSVGGTWKVPEEAIPLSSGGFSDRFPQPKYQREVVDEFLHDLGDRWKGLFNPRGRGFPDIAAQAHHYVVADHGQFILVDGTSAAGPTVAAIVYNLNSVRFANKKKQLGFLNPLIYSAHRRHKGKGFHDITTGGSRGCTGRDQFSNLPTPIVPFASWNATKGWDPVTGLGTLNFKELRELVEQL